MAHMNASIVVEDFRPHKDELRFSNTDKLFKVKELTNNIDYVVGEFITEEEVRNICARTWMKIRIVKAPV